jgi:hypothetical protein
VIQGCANLYAIFDNESVVILTLKIMLSVIAAYGSCSEPLVLLGL